MAGKDEKTKQTKPKKQSTIKQIITIFKYTHKEDKMLPALIAGAFLVPVIVFVILGIIFRWTVLTWVFLMLIAIMLGMLLSTIVLTRRADMVGYKQLDGKTGAFQRGVGGIEHRSDRLLVGLPTVHVERVEALVHVFRSRRAGAAAAGHVENVTVVAIAAHVGGDDAVGVGTIAQNCRAGAVAEEDGGIAILPIDD